MIRNSVVRKTAPTLLRSILVKPLDHPASLLSSDFPCWDTAVLLKSDAILRSSIDDLGFNNLASAIQQSTKFYFDRIDVPHMTSGVRGP